MNQHAMSADFQPHRIETRPSGVDALTEPAMTRELLPFTVRLVRDEDDLDKAVQIRHSAYARHLPVFAESLKAAETADADNGVVVLLAESKLDGSPLGTMRIQTNQFKPLCLEQSVELPAWLKARPLAEATRLGVTDGKGGRLVTTVLFKAFYQYCLQTGIEWMVVTGRAPVDRMYDRLLFKDVFPGMGYIPFSHVGNLPHRVMSLEVDAVEPSWAAAKQPLYDFFFHTHHPDLDVSDHRQPLTAPLTRQPRPAQSAMLPM
ncbi:hypothetical protein [Rhodoferax ferrireducens]|uniref:hypothetical protein n=1 Tax=Rhodoferax ferrireducens TaxID=192843 RepID=UPI0018E56D13|nr:hypothetical protein [Rhodoferax ferrireducens]